jgi:hypothetical protein
LLWLTRLLALPFATIAASQHRSQLAWQSLVPDPQSAPVTSDRGNEAKKRLMSRKLRRKRLEKEKTPQGRLFCIFMLEGQKGVSRLFPFYYKLINKIVIKQIINALMNA